MREVHRCCSSLRQERREQAPAGGQIRGSGSFFARQRKASEKDQNNTPKKLAQEGTFKKRPSMTRVSYFIKVLYSWTQKNGPGWVIFCDLQV